MGLKIKLRPIGMSDVDNLLTWVNDPEVVGKFATFDHEFTREDEERYVATVLAKGDEKVFAIENEAGEYIGQVGLHEIEWRNSKVRGAMVIRKEHQNRGYGQQALNELLRTAFDEYGIHKFWLIVDPKNERGRHIYQKMGFKEEGLLKDEYFRNGEFRDMVRMYMLDSMFREKNGGGKK